MWAALRGVARVVAVVLVNVLVCVTLAESIALAVWYARDRTLYYVRPHHIDRAPRARSEGGSRTQALHPVLGFIRTPATPVTAVASRDRLDRMVGPGLSPGWLDLRANNYGFFAAEDYPTIGGGHDDLVIGVFGGSAAQWFALQGADRLAEALSPLGPGQPGRIRVLCFAQSGFKQPQQLEALVYFLARGQKFDVILNLDGFNETALAAANPARGLDIGMPSAQQLIPLVELAAGAGASPETLSAALAASRAAKRVGAFERRLDRTRSAAVGLLVQGALRFARDHAAQTAAQLDRLAKRPDGTAIVHLNAPFPPVPAADVYESQADLWMSSSLLMEAVARSTHARYVHVLQPNQYFGARAFSKAEASIALDPASPYRVPVALGYPHLVSRLEAMRRQGVAAFSATGIFDATAAPTYADSCCHYTQLGNELLAAFAASRIKEALSE